MIATTKNTKNPYCIDISAQRIFIEADKKEAEGAMYLYTLTGTQVYAEAITEGVTKITKKISSGNYVLQVTTSQVSHVEIISVD